MCFQVKEEQRKERTEAIERYNKKKKNQHKQLCKKTFRGQPNFGAQMDMLLQKIQNSS